jgi:hypothetical protein
LRAPRGGGGAPRPGEADGEGRALRSMKQTGVAVGSGADSRELQFQDCPEIARRSCRCDQVLMPPLRGRLSQASPST